MFTFTCNVILDINAPYMYMYIWILSEQSVFRWCPTNTDFNHAIIHVFGVTNSFLFPLQDPCNDFMKNSASTCISTLLLGKKCYEIRTDQRDCSITHV